MDRNFDIAVTGMACRFPGADDAADFWKNLAAGIESISRFTDDELRNSGVPDSLINSQHYVKASPVISSPDMFDASFFGYTPLEAKMMDPQHRLLLECAYHALENAGCNPETFNGRIGVFTGSAMNTYFMNAALRSKFVDEYIPTLISNDKDFLSTRISYKLNLKGPSINVQTACSTSLVAIHLACQSLISGESDLVLAGAVSVKVPHNAGYIADGGGIVSPDARVRAFDAKANGTVFGSGCGIVVLKRLEDAVNDKDTILAVIKGTAVNNDGSEKAGYTAPGVNSQAEVMIEALSLADISAESISYIEAHGSGTPIGDPIEIAALTKAFRSYTEKRKFCAVGSVKTNIGHLDAAAGIAGFIKTVLSLQNKMIPPSLNFTSPNPEIDFENSPFYVNTALRKWQDDGLRRAAVISTGMGGTNACIIIEEAPERIKSEQNDVPVLLTLSSKTEEALQQYSRELSKQIIENKELNLPDIGYTLQKGRRAYNFRKYLLADNKDEAASLLAEENPKRVLSGKTTGSRPIIFLFPGIGDHYVGMGSDLYKNFPVFKEEVDKCAEILNNYLDTDIRDILYPANYLINKKRNQTGIDLKSMLAGRTDKPTDPETEKLNKTVYVQPVLFTIEYALAKLWMSLGIKPEAIAGHSMGEYTAAALAGVFSLNDALKIVARRALLVNALPQGRMIAVNLREKDLAPLLTEGISISLINSPDLCVAAGSEKEVEFFEKNLTEKKILFRHVQNGHAFHSRMLEPIREQLTNEFRNVKLKRPQIPFTSNITGNWITGEDAVNPEYWGKHAISTARFSDALGTVWQVNNCILLEIGPGNTLSVLASQHPESRKNINRVTVSSLRARYDYQDDVKYLLNSAGKLWLAGTDFIWEKFYGNHKPSLVPLPAYPFRKERYWIESVQEHVSSGNKETVIPKNPDIEKWFYVPYWKRMLPKHVEEGEVKNAIGTGHKWLVFLDKQGSANKIIQRLVTEGQDVFTVSIQGTPGIDRYIIDVRDHNSYDALVRALREKDFVPEYIVHAFNLNDDDEDTQSDDALFREKQETGFYSLIHLVKALSRNNILNEIKLFVLSSNVQDVTGSESLSPEKSTVLGPCMVIPQEHQNILARSIDLEAGELENNMDGIFGEFLMSGSDTFTAYRSGYRWVQAYENVELDTPRSSILKTGGVYLITGGLGEVCYHIAEYLADTYKAKLILVNRTELTGRGTAGAGNEENNSVADKIEKIKRLEALGSEVHYFNANAADEAAMRQVISQTNELYGRLDGVIHGAGLVGEKGFSAIQDIDIVKCELHFTAKEKALYTLRKVLEGTDIDFCMLMSSLTPVLGGLREVAYSSSNIFMDSYARKLNRSRENKWISVNWDLWRTNKKASEHNIGKTLSELGILPHEGMKVLEKVLNLKAPQIVVSTGDLNARINQWIKLESLKQKDSAQKFFIEKTSGISDIETEGIEQIMSGIWKEILGVEIVKKDDNFFELGGHSLLAIQLITSIRRNFQIDFGLEDIFNSFTLADMSNKITEMILTAEA